jgi:hypothetical protein
LLGRGAHQNRFWDAQEPAQDREYDFHCGAAYHRRPSPVNELYKLIFDIVRESGLGTHLTMSDVFKRAASKRPGIGFSTVYPGIGGLRDFGLIA